MNGPRATHPDAPRALVTGATGFTGGRLCRHLRVHGYHVTALARPGRDTSALRRSGIDIVEGCLEDRRSLERAVRNQDVVYHVAAAFRDASLPDREFFAVNVEGTRNVIHAAASAGVPRFVHCSTVGVHGDTGRTPATEESPFKAPDAYCASKIEGELAARALFQELGIAGSVFRPMGIYGPGDTRFLKLFRSVSRGHFVMIGEGEVWYHMTYIDDLCRGIILCGEHPAAVGEVFLLAGPRHTTLNELVRYIAEATGSRPPRLRVPMAPVMAAARVCDAVCRPLGIPPPLYPRRVEFFSKDRAADTGKARRLLGYAPRVDLEEGVRLTAASYRRLGWL